MSLIARLEAATGPDRELDAEIVCALNGYTIHEDTRQFFPKHFAFWSGKPWESLCSNCSSWPEYTSSLDAALSLGRDEAEAMAALYWATCGTISVNTTQFQVRKRVILHCLKARGHE